MKTIKKYLKKIELSTCIGFALGSFSFITLCVGVALAMYLKRNPNPKCYIAYYPRQMQPQLKTNAKQCKTNANSMFLYLDTNMFVSKIKMCCVVYKSKMQTNANPTQIIYFIYM